MELKTILIAIGIVLALALLWRWIVFAFKKRKNRGKNQEISNENIDALVAYVRAQKEHAEHEMRLKELKKADMKNKLEAFRQTKEQLKDKLRAQIDKKDWRPLDSILKTADKGGVGIYILFNQTKNKYYVGQAKQIYKRIRDHFDVEQIAMDYLSGDAIAVKILTANELDHDYRLDHIEKTGIEIFNSSNSGYNKTSGNL